MYEENHGIYSNIHIFLMTYIEELEQQNEKLRQQLEKAEQWKPYFVKTSEKDNRWNYLTPIDLIATIVSNKNNGETTVDYNDNFFCGFFTQDDCKDLRELYFNSLEEAKNHLEHVIGVMLKQDERSENLAKDFLKY